MNLGTYLRTLERIYEYSRKILKSFFKSKLISRVRNFEMSTTSLHEVLRAEAKFHWLKNKLVKPEVYK